eukprot:TRINITY_DN80869_c0_g1_i1.p1 TRINITY_DN80869_c0_g1~~TRINITY_DN80869_c0_g1_i1.p1  ORF type:complete len:134 (+),score=19.36 TRINITY_DN80869_c0_g1_i1:48-449(+)
MVASVTSLSFLSFCILAFATVTAGIEELRFMAQDLSFEECEKHDREGDLWVVVDSYVVDLSAFLAHHPGTASRILQKRKAEGADISRNFLDHFGHTVKTFRKACQEFDRSQQPVSFSFKEVPSAEVIIRGKLK